ncbi:SGNH hydrolase-type esterase domain-containing protein [Filobasidium floriforme]|uniref:SGNH hydrolase-type esterase domain-containing protein n=1 Tax=Filobasidium floriforme TaxID=5210 RepID=UPI001E8D6573|nr:SGNH hydrolase-type esterase domain-containing protein [Filobasidium floriforme]KAH8083170.1 SGNH hydrolase-type esterase domain-containing protein [Filobasidium floriforme]
MWHRNPGWETTYSRRGAHNTKPVKKQTALEPAFVLIGDSTTANNTVTPNSGGWGDGFCASLRPGVSCSNFGSNGATTGTIVDRGVYGDALGRVKEQVGMGKAVFVTLQFGHNDQKVGPPESTAQNLTRFVEDIQGLGANPILLTPLSRRSFNENGTIADQLAAWGDAARGVATANNDPLLPLLEASIHYLESIGQAPSQLLNRLPADRTHLNVGGQHLFGRMVADLMRLFVPFEERYGTSEPFVVDAPLSEAIWTGKQYVYTAVCPSYNASDCEGIAPAGTDYTK